MIERRRRLSPEQREERRAHERRGDIISRLGGVRLAEQPRTGYWLMRVVRGGPEVPAAIQWEQTTREPGEPDNLMERSSVLTARIAGKVVDLDRVWTWTKRAITEAEYQWRLANAAWAQTNAPHEPAANPHKKIDLLTAPTPF